MTVGHGGSSGGRIPTRGTIPVASPDTNAIRVREILNNPGTTIMTISIMPSSVAPTYRVVYGTDNKMRSSIAEQGTVDETREDFNLTGLTAGTQYHYQVQAKDAQGRWHPRAQHAFWTLQAAGEPVHGCFIADSHFPQAWIAADCGNTEDDLYDDRVGRALQTAKNMVSRGCEWVVDLGDTSTTHCTSCSTACDVVSGSTPGDFPLGVGTVGAGSLNNLRWVTEATAKIEADSRYEVMLDVFVHEFARSMPFFTVIGNHDGEYGGEDDGDDVGGDGRAQTCNVYDGSGTSTGAGDVAANGINWSLDNLSEDARNKFMKLPNGTSVFDCGSNGDCFSFSTGVFRFVGLNKYKFLPNTGGGPGNLPDTADEWPYAGTDNKTFVDAQLAVSSFTEPFKAVGVHSVFGGIRDGNHCMWYARGGIRSTDTGLSTGTFEGEQSTLQATMKAAATRAQIFIYGHDHTTVMGEKLESDSGGSGVHYIVAGRPNSVIGSWNLGRPFSRQNYDQTHSPDIDETLDFTINAVVSDNADTRGVTRDDGSSWVTAGYAIGDAICFEDFDNAANKRCCLVINFADDGATDDQVLLEGGPDGGVTGLDNRGNCDTDLVAVSGDNARASRPLPDFERSPVLEDNPGDDIAGFVEMTCNAQVCDFTWVQTDESDSTLNNVDAFTYTVPVN